MESISSHTDIYEKLKNNSKSILLLYKSNHLESECVYRNLEIAEKHFSSVSVYSADINTVMDILPKYGVSYIPSFLIFEDAEFKDVFKGCKTNNQLKTIMDNLTNQVKKNVIVYSTPTCGWCNTLKNWLGEKGVVYSDIDISRDQKLAQDLINRSGQQGVPQTEINGQIVLGFNQKRLKELLEIE